MAAPAGIVSHPVATCHVDWLQATYRLASNDRLDELYALSQCLADQALCGGQWVGPTPSKHFTHAMRHPAGVMLHYSPFQSAASEIEKVRNEGLASIEFSGTFFGLLTAAERQQVYVDVGTLSGFYRCNRLDSQITVLDPSVDALAIVGLVERRELWPVGFGRGQAYCERLWSGQIVGAVTQYFGGRSSRVRARIYDKAAEQGWSVPAVRFEVQERREVADQHFRRLVRECQHEGPLPPLLVTAEDRTVRNIVGAQLDLRDTSAWVDRERPQRWAQYAPVPGWWRETVAQQVSPIEVTYRKPADLAASYAAAAEQYGRKLTLECIRRAVTEGTDLDYQALLWLLRGAQKLRREDRKQLLDLLPDEFHEDAHAMFDAVCADAAEYSEEVVDLEPVPPRV